MNREELERIRRQWVGQTMQVKKDKEIGEGLKKETVEEFLARGGVIKKGDPIEIQDRRDACSFSTHPGILVARKGML